MTYLDKLDMLDLLITALKEHEKKLDDLINRLENKLEKKEIIIIVKEFESKQAST